MSKELYVWVRASDELPEQTESYAKFVVVKWQFSDNIQIRVVTANEFADLIVKVIVDLTKIEWLKQVTLDELGYVSREKYEEANNALHLKIIKLKTALTKMQVIIDDVLKETATATFDAKEHRRNGWQDARSQD